MLTLIIPRVQFAGYTLPDFDHRDDVLRELSQVHIILFPYFDSVGAYRSYVYNIHKNDWFLLNMKYPKQAQFIIEDKYDLIELKEI